MSKEDKLIPELRFPEFVNDGEWEEKKLENYIDLFSGIALKSEELSDDKSGVPILRGINITEGCVRHSKDIDKYYLGDINNLEKYLVKENDIVIGMDGSKVGKNVAMISKKDENSILIQRVARIRINKDADINFVYQYFISDKFINYVDTVNTSSGIPHISAQQIKDFKVGIPLKINEQQKIASCLSSLDEVITAHSQKLDLLKDHKKGLMQNLFPQEGETLPKVRFKEFEKDGDWVEKKLEDLFTIGNGRDYRDLAKGNIPVYGSGGLMLTVDQFLYDGESVCIGRKGTIDKPMFLSGKFWTVDTLFYTHSFKGCIPKYIFYVFEKIKWKNHNEAGGVPSLSKANIYKIEIIVPKTIQEQQKIASCLSSLDALITAQSEKIEQLKLHKKGLMQGLFPKIND